MPLRVLDYVVQIFKYQVREWSKTHRSFARIRLAPVLPVVFYTGTRRWDSVGRLVDLVEIVERFETATPAIEPVFINRPRGRPCRKQSNRRSRRTNIARRFSRCREQLPTSWKKRGR